ncbi:MAG: histidine kinase [Melioribacteraceae bacterium]|nr:histidine kinase [Melioribacteraceae bacterium]MCF8356853.1 histidine kinase [Melioribacteraceae bacterium]MCF8396232.1 histidine kinase [Melioribacteraceae bacterium]
MYIYPVVTTALIIFVVHEWFKKEKLRLETQKGKLEAELKYLKNQINPHFLFNTINNIYSLVLEESAKAPRALLKLSDMMNYLLYESNADKIELSKEIQNLQDYIELEKFRYGDKLEVIFNYEVRSSDITIPPLMLLPFVENAFKHGAGESLESSWIHINLNEANHHLTFKVENSIDEKVGTKNEENGGIGLSNVKKRLELMFHNKHKLKTLKSSESFIIILQLDLSDDKK